MTRLLKDNMVSASRKRRMTTADLNISGDTKSIFINEHLTSYNKQLLKNAKEVCKNKQYIFTWTKNGRVYVRKGDTSPALWIAIEEDLKKIV
ncbi:unnamed protein product [Diatraea saccharalis]|uniref:FP protein C-terminal domain-containing protein n=1 Tax=Diatraea saccharalis TaxID=40085 RepID=A0A9N9R4Y4_9NEOP|nr:unnamed protein product [Diatraea saccharalis]